MVGVPTLQCPIYGIRTELLDHLARRTMEPPKPSNPLLSFSTFIHQHCLRLGAELATRLDDSRRLAVNWPPLALKRSRPLNSLPFASVSQEARQAKRDLGGALGSDHVANSLAGTAVYTVSNSNNEFVLISDPNGVKSVGLLCFRQEDAEAFLAQVQSRKRELRSQARVVPISLDQVSDEQFAPVVEQYKKLSTCKQIQATMPGDLCHMAAASGSSGLLKSVAQYSYIYTDEVYMLKVEGIAFRFLPDPVQIKNALELKATDTKSGFDGVPVFQSDLLVVKKKNRRYCPIYFQKEDIEKELSKVPRSSRGPVVTQHIMVGSLEDVLRKMETSEKNLGWEDLIFIPPGKSHSQHIQEVAKR